MFRYQYLTGTNSNPVSNIPILIPFQPIKIEKIVSGAPYPYPSHNYKLINEKGVEYYFEKWDSLRYDMHWNFTTCHLTKIVSMDKKDTICFQYNLSEIYYTYDYPQAFYIGCRSIQTPCNLFQSVNCEPFQGIGNDIGGDQIQM